MGQSSFSKPVLGAKLSAVGHRVKIHETRDSNMISKSKSDAARELRSKNFDRARVEAGHIIMLQNKTTAKSLIATMCRLLKDRVEGLAHLKIMPPDIVEAVHTVCWASTRLSEIDELSQIRQIFAARFPDDVRLACTDGAGAAINSEMRIRLSNGVATMDEIAAVLSAVAKAENIEFDSATDLASSRIGMGSGVPSTSARGGGDGGGGGGGATVAIVANSAPPPHQQQLVLPAPETAMAAIFNPQVPTTSAQEYPLTQQQQQQQQQQQPLPFQGYPPQPQQQAQSNFAAPPPSVMIFPQNPPIVSLLPAHAALPVVSTSIPLPMYPPPQAITSLPTVGGAAADGDPEKPALTLQERLDRLRK